jgi:hypothetical protein
VRHAILGRKNRFSSGILRGGTLDSLIQGSFPHSSTGFWQKEGTKMIHRVFSIVSKEMEAYWIPTFVNQIDRAQIFNTNSKLLFSWHFWYSSIDSDNAGSGNSKVARVNVHRFVAFMFCHSYQNMNERAATIQRPTTNKQNNWRLSFHVNCMVVKYHA